MAANGVRVGIYTLLVVAGGLSGASRQPTPPQNNIFFYLEERRFPAAVYPHQPQLLPPANRKLEVLELEAGAVEGVAETLRHQHLRRASHHLFSPRVFTTNRHIDKTVLETVFTTNRHTDKTVLETRPPRLGSIVSRLWVCSLFYRV